MARYDGPDGLADVGRAVAVDDDGNVYVTGESYTYAAASDYVTVKYDPAGNQLWAARYDGPAHSHDTPYDLAIDDAGNVYVTGWSAGSGSALDYATVKYDSSGNELWVARYNGPTNERDWARSIDLDPSGNVYVTGASEGTVYQDLTTVKYDSDGHELWASRWAGYWRINAEATALVVDDSGNAYATGWVTVPVPYVGFTVQYATLKYDTAGNLLWAAQYAGPGHADRARGIALDDAGNVHVTGDSYDPATSTDFATVKYDSSGNELWVARYNGPDDLSDSGLRVAVDEGGNVCVLGSSYGNATGRDIAVVKYDASGNQLWTARYAGPGYTADVALAIATDDLGAVYVAGTQASNLDYVTVKYDHAGQLVWTATYDGPAGGQDQAWDMVLDDAGNIYVTGWSQGAARGPYDIATVKYSQDPVAALGGLIGAVNALIGDGALGAGEGNALIAKLENAFRLLTDPVDRNDIAAMNEVLAFINQVQGLMAAGVLTEEVGQPLIAYADGIAARIMDGA